MIKMVVFDLDGTLVDSLKDLALNVNKGLKAAGLEERPIENYKKYVGDGREVMIQRAMGEHGENEELAKTVRSVFNSEYAVHCNDNTSAYPGCRELLSELDKRKIITAVNSNKPNEFVEKILKKVYPEHSFAETWGKRPEYKMKPDPSALEEMLKIHNIEKAECIYIGDSDVDVYTAKNAGVKMAGVEWGFRGREELMRVGAEFVASSPEELLKYIAGIK